MSYIGKIQWITIDLIDRKPVISLKIDEGAIDSLKDLIAYEKLDISMKKHREKRSLDANAYCWVLLQKMAEILKTDKWSLYLQMLKEYGQFTHVVVKEQAVEAMKRQWRECEVLGPIKVGGMTGIQLQCYFGSSTYDTKQMSDFIDGIVREAQELGIDTRTPDEIEHMKAVWGV